MKTTELCTLSKQLNCAEIFDSHNSSIDHVHARDSSITVVAHNENSPFLALLCSLLCSSSSPEAS